jgi:hypothetical protein
LSRVLGRACNELRFLVTPDWPQYNPRHETPRNKERPSATFPGDACLSGTKGHRRREFATIGKETNRRWERADDVSVLESDVIVYRPNETERLVTDIGLQRELNARRVSGDRQLAKVAGVSRGTVKAAKRGQRVRKSSTKKLRTELKKLR